MCYHVLQHAGTKGQFLASWKRRHSARQVWDARKENLFDRPGHRRQPRLRAQGRLRYVPERLEVSLVSEHITTSPVWTSGAVELGLLRFQAEGRTRRPNLALVFLATVFKTVPLCDVDVLWPNGWMDQDTTWYGGRPRPRGHCLRWGPSSPTERNTAAPHFLAHVYCGQTVAHLSNCWALVFCLFCVVHSGP